MLEVLVSIVRQGLAEDGKFAAGYEAIFGKGKGAAAEAKSDAKRKKAPAKAKAKKAGGKKPTKKK